jgi:CO/xanthine dehydrogenase Mo-binding subunit
MTSQGQNAKGVGARLPRKEDARFLRGQGRYVADVQIPGTWEIAFCPGRTSVASACFSPMTWRA